MSNRPSGTEMGGVNKRPSGAEEGSVNKGPSGAEEGSVSKGPSGAEEGSVNNHPSGSCIHMVPHKRAVAARRLLERKRNGFGRRDNQVNVLVRLRSSTLLPFQLGRSSEEAVETVCRSGRN